MSVTDYAAIHKEISLPCVRIRADKAGGSGTVIYSAEHEGSWSSYVLTNHHVIDGLIKVEERWDPLLGRDAKRDVRGLAEAHFFEYQWESRQDGTSAVEAEVAAYDKDEDLGLLRLRSSRPAPAIAKLYPRGQEKELRIGMPVLCVGAGLGEPPVMTTGRLSVFGREIEHKEFWLSTAPAIYGNSGGALFLEETHEFIGVPSRIAVTNMLFSSDAITHLQYCIPITRVYNFLADQKYRFIYDSTFTEDGETEERKKVKEQDKLRQVQDEEKRS